MPKELNGNCGIGHVRYSTQMTSEVKFAQPFLCKGISVAHNGNISDFSGFNGKSDTENLLESIIAEVSELTFERIGKFLDKKIKNGAYSIVFCLNSRVFAYRDKFGFRPLFFCEADEGYFVGSEDIAFSGLKVIKRNVFTSYCEPHTKQPCIKLPSTKGTPACVNCLNTRPVNTVCVFTSPKANTKRSISLPVPDVS